MSDINDTVEQAVEPAKKWLGLGNESGLFGRFGQTSLAETVKHNFDQVVKGAQFWDETSKGHKGVAFGRVAGTGVGLAIAGDALFRGKTNDGQDRSLLFRIVEFIVGGGVAATSVLAGKAR